jgi:hypothetical protein
MLKKLQSKMIHYGKIDNLLRITKLYPFHSTGKHIGWLY